MTVVTDFIAEELAKIERVHADPAPPFGYGTDLSCTDDLTATMDEVSGQTVLAQALVRRLITQRGSLQDDPSYGIDIRSYCNGATPLAEIRALAGVIKNELSKDDRVDTLTVTVTPSSDATTLRIDIRVTPVDASTGVFTLTLAATSATVVLEAMRQAA